MISISAQVLNWEVSLLNAISLVALMFERGFPGTYFLSEIVGENNTP